MKLKSIQFLGLLVAVALVAVLSCRFTGHFFLQPQAHSGYPHSWVHEQLGITPEQEERLIPIEARYQERRRLNEGIIRTANRTLAAAILEDRGKSPRTDEAVEQIHDAMGELQKATLDHLFEMEAVLSPEQYDKLLRLTAEGLHEISGD